MSKGPFQALREDAWNPSQDSMLRVRIMLLEEHAVGRFHPEETGTMPVQVRSLARYIFELDLLCVDSVILYPPIEREMGEKANTRIALTCPFGESARVAIAQVDTQRKLLTQRIKEMHGDAFTAREVAA